MRRRPRKSRSTAAKLARAAHSGRDKPRLRPGRHTEFYTAGIPAWDVSLGDFVCFEGCCGQRHVIEITDE